MSKTKPLGHEIDENGIKLNEENVEANRQIQPPEETKNLKSILGATQFMKNSLSKLS